MEWFGKLDLRLGRIGRKKLFVLSVPIWAFVVMMIVWGENISQINLNIVEFLLADIAFFMVVILAFYLSFLRLHDSGLSGGQSIMFLFFTTLFEIFSERFADVVSKSMSVVFFIIPSNPKGNKYGTTDNDLRGLISFNKRIGRLRFFIEILLVMGYDSLIRGCYNISVANDKFLFIVLMLVFIVLNLFFWCNVYCRRLHDSGKPGKEFCMVFAGLYIARHIFPELGGVFLAFAILSTLYLLFIKGDSEENEYGQPMTTIPWMKD